MFSSLDVRDIGVFTGLITCTDYFAIGLIRYIDYHKNLLIYRLLDMVIDFYPTILTVRLIEIIMSDNAYSAK